MNIITLYAVHQGDDDRSWGHPTWWFDNKTKADNIAKGRGWYGGDAPVSQHAAIKIEDDQYLILQNVEPIRLGGPDDEKLIRAKALKKLTKLEKEILGLDK